MAKGKKYVILIDGCPSVVDEVDENQEVNSTYQYDDDFDYGSINVSDLVLEMFHENLTRLYCIEKIS